MSVMNILAASKRLGFVLKALDRVGITEAHVEEAAASEAHDFIASRFVDSESASALDKAYKAAQADHKAVTEKLASFETAARAALNITSGGPLDENIIAASVDVLVKDRAAKIAAEDIASRGFRPQAGANETREQTNPNSGATFSDARAKEIESQLGIQRSKN